VRQLAFEPGPALLELGERCSIAATRNARTEALPQLGAARAIAPRAHGSRVPPGLNAPAGLCHAPSQGAVAEAAAVLTTPARQNREPIASSSRWISSSDTLAVSSIADERSLKRAPSAQRRPRHEHVLGVRVDQLARWVTSRRGSRGLERRLDPRPVIGEEIVRGIDELPERRAARSSRAPASACTARWVGWTPGLKLRDLAFELDDRGAGLVGAAARLTLRALDPARRVASGPTIAAWSSGFGPLSASSQTSSAANVAAGSGSASSLASLRWARTRRAYSTPAARTISLASSRRAFSPACSATSRSCSRVRSRVRHATVPSAA